MPTDSSRSDKRFRLVPPDMQPDRAAIWRRFLSYFLRKEKLKPEDPSQRRVMAERLLVGHSSVNTWYGGRGLPDIMVFARFFKLYPLCNLRWLFWGEGAEEMVRGATMTDREAVESELRAKVVAGLEQIDATVEKVRLDVTGTATVRDGEVAARQRKAMEAARRLFHELEQAVQTTTERQESTRPPKRGAR